MRTTVLIVDDHAGFRRFARRLLEDSGYVVVGEAADGESACAAADRLRPDAVLLDLLLPDTSGIDILKRVKDNKYLKATPVVVLTTTDDSHEIKRCYELGCNVYITKPVNYESFANAIRQLGLFFSVIQVPPAAT